MQSMSKYALTVLLPLQTQESSFSGAPASFSPAPFLPPSHHVSPFVSCVTQTRSPNRSERIFPPSEVVVAGLPVLPQAAETETAADDSPVGGGGGGGRATPSLLLLRRIISGSGDGVDLKR